MEETVVDPAPDLGAVFTSIYERRVWGRSNDPDEKFFSGTGSHTAAITQPYVDEVNRFLAHYFVFHGRKPDVVDLGCGDFSVGRKIRPACGHYLACDVVASLIERNQSDHPDVDFRVLDITRDELPGGDVVFIRQVLQHLPNAKIAQVAGKLKASYRFLVLTEHLPASADFTPNLDMPVRAGIRLGYNQSGVVLTRPPFNLEADGEFPLCAVPEGGGLIRTTLYKLRG